MAPQMELYDMHLVKENLLARIVLMKLEQDMKLMGETIQRPGPYIDFINRAVDLQIKEHSTLRAAVRKRGIRINTEIRGENNIEITYVCRGYEHMVNCMWRHLKAETEIRIRRLFGEDIRRYLKQDVPDWETANQHLLHPPPYLWPS